MLEYAIYPFEFMRITQRHDEGNHLPHWKNSKNYSDKPFDEAVYDGGRQYFIPKNDFVVEEVMTPPRATNTVRLKSVNKLRIPYQDRDEYLYLTLTHMNDDTMKKLKKGMKVPKGSKIILEGSAPPSSGNHFHITANLGKYYGFLKNSNGSWCFTYEKSLMPNEAFYVNENVKILNAKNYVFKQCPKTAIKGVLRDESKKQIEVLATNLRMRLTPNGAIIGYVPMGIYNILGEQGEWKQIDKDIWIAHNPTWSKLYEIKEIVEEEVKEDIVEEIEEEIKEVINDDQKNEIIEKSFLQTILKFIKKLFKI